MHLPLLPTTVVGSYPQPDWLVNRELLSKVVPRVRMSELWRIPEPYLEQAQNDATLIAIRDMERAGIDIITDGEMRRESYSNRFATALAGVDIDTPGSALDRTGHPNPVPRVAGAIARARPVEVEDVRFLRANTERTIKITLPGPFTMAQQAQDDFYKDDEALALAYAAAVNAEARDLKAAGADIIQLDEPYLQARPQKALQYGVKAINRALDGIAGPTARPRSASSRRSPPAPPSSAASSPADKKRGWPQRHEGTKRFVPRHTITPRCSRSSAALRAANHRGLSVTGRTPPRRTTSSCLC